MKLELSNLQTFCIVFIINNAFYEAKLIKKKAVRRFFRELNIKFSVIKRIMKSG